MLLLRLTPREAVLLEKMLAGMTNAEIAAEMHVCRRTVSHAASSIYRKCGLGASRSGAGRARLIGRLFVAEIRWRLRDDVRVVKESIRGEQRWICIGNVAAD